MKTPDGIMLNELPYPPSVNRIWRQHAGRTLLSREGRDYRAMVAQKLSKSGINRPAYPLTGRIEITVDIFPPDRRRRDIDNVQKALFDAMQHAGLYEDDSQIDRITLNRRNPVAGGSVTIWLTETHR